jgi:hypothetical protein
MVTPLILIVDVHPFLALAAGERERAIHIDPRLVEERFGLLGPDFEPRLVEHVEQRADMLGSESPAEVASRRRIGNALRADRVEIHFVVAAQFDVVQARAVAERIEREVQHMIALMVGQMDLQQTQPLIDGFGQLQPADEQEHRADAALGHAPRAVGQLILDVGGPEHGPIAAGVMTLVESQFDASLASGEFPS